MKLLTTIRESLDSPYHWRNSFKTELQGVTDDETGEEHQEDRFSPVQIVRFTTGDGTPFIWYARQNRYSDGTWEIAFGVHTGDGLNDEHQLDIKKTGRGNAFRVFATVVDIINHFVQYDENYEIQRLTMQSEGANRTQLYLKRIVPKIEDFELEGTYPQGGDETEIHLLRTR